MKLKKLVGITKAGAKATVKAGKKGYTMAKNRVAHEKREFVYRFLKSEAEKKGMTRQEKSILMEARRIVGKNY